MTAPARAPLQDRPQRPLFRAGTDLVIVNVVVRDRNGAVVRNLTQDDFAITEDDRPETISSFDFEELDREEPPRAVQPQPVLGKRLAGHVASGPGATSSDPGTPKLDMHGRRLIVLFLDLSSMLPEEIKRVVDAAHEYVDRTLAVDLIAVASFSTSLRVDLDFTADREALNAAVDGFAARGQGFDTGLPADPESGSDNGLTSDDTEFNVFNTDRRLDALQRLSDTLAGIQQKKSVVYFSSGMNQSGNDNQVRLRRTIDRANRANVSLYAVDMRGLQPNVPGGGAAQASARGVAALSGASISDQVGRLAASQDTLMAVSEDTGGRALLGSNTFGNIFRQVVADTSAYCVLGYATTNPARDGRFRRIKLAVRRAGLKLKYRSGYYAARDSAHATPDDPAGTPGLLGIRVFTSIAYFRGGVRVFETPPVEIKELNAPDRSAASFQFELPTASLPPGIYTCQVNVIDDVAGAFSFPRVQLVRR